jgi:hypothetical protein
MSPLSLDRLLQRAALSHDQLHDGPWQEALQRLLDSLQATADLDAMRQEQTARQLAHSLATRHRLQLAGPPERVPDDPIVVVGFPRSGTTLLQNLLASHPEHLAHPLWALRRPLWTEAERDHAIAEAGSWLDLLHQLTPDFARIHPMHALRPDECSWLLRQSFATEVYAYQYVVPDYAAWLASADLRWAYAELAQQLGHLGHASRSGVGRRVLLKDPCHLWHLDALLDTFPRATLVHLHRAPHQVVPSLASLIAAMQSFGTRQRSPDDVGAYAYELAASAMERMLAVRADLPERHPDVTVVDLSYRELVSDPVAACHRICRAAGSATHPGVAHRITDWLDHNPAGKHGRHRYTLEGFGLDADAVTARFAPYTDRFPEAST